MKIKVSFNPLFIIFILATNMLMVDMDTYILNTAIPSIATYFSMNFLDLKISLIIYLVTLSFILPINGWLIEKFGIRIVFFVSLSIFSLSSLGCGLSTNFWSFIIFRGLQGFGGAFALTLSRFAVMYFFKHEDYVKNMSQFGLIAGFAGLIGPAIGGFIVTHFSWQWIFFINIPIAILLGLFAIKYLPNNQRQNTPAPYWLSYIYFCLGTIFTIFALSLISNLNFDTKYSCLYLFLGLLMIYLYHRKDKHVLRPIIDSTLFEIRTCNIALKAGVVVRILTGSLPFILPLLFQNFFGYTPEQSGFLILPMALGTLTVRFIMTQVLKFWGYKNALIFTSCLLALCEFIYVFVDRNTSIILIVFINFILGGGISFLYSATNYLAHEDITKDKAAAIASLTSIIHYTMNGVGIAFAVLLLRLYSFKELSLESFRYLFLTLSILLILSLLNYKSLTIAQSQGH
jgi:MFS family permease